MQSRRDETAKEARKHASIQAQIKHLKNQLPPGERDVDAESKRNQPPGLLVPATPSPKKKRKADHFPLRKPEGQASSTRPVPQQRPTAKPTNPLVSTPPPSNLGSALATFNSKKPDRTPPKQIARSNGFSENPRAQQRTDEADSLSRGRNEDLTVAEDLTLGPTEHVPPFDDPHFQHVEPNSRINLSSRSLSHDDLQEYLRGRYYISPSRLYSVARLLPNKQAYDVPVVGDWVTIAVIAERGQISVSRGGGSSVSKKDDDAEQSANDDEDEPAVGQKNDVAGLLDPSPPRKASSSKFEKGQGKKTEPPKKKVGKKYLTLKLVDFGHRSSGSGAQRTIKGDAVLSMILFEADSYATIRDGKGLADRVYRGGSGGAFEACAKLRTGAVIAILNPKILKPFQRTGTGASKPNPTDNVLALSPENAKSIAVIGMSKDLGLCSVIKRDGNKCDSWLDRRVADVCEYHLQHAIQSRRASRPEFTAGTGGMTSRGKTDYDPTKKWGLTPSSLEPSSVASRTSASLGGGTTYVLSGHVVSHTNATIGKREYVHEVLGRGRSEKLKRKRDAAADEEVLQALLGRDGGKTDGAKALEKARNAIEEMKKPKIKGKDKGKEKEVEKSEEKKKVGYTVSTLRAIGFDPTARGGLQTKLGEEDAAKRRAALEALQSSKSKVFLRPKPGVKIRSGVRAPATENLLPRMLIADSDDELEIEGVPSTTSIQKIDTIALGEEESEDELEIEPPM